MSCPLLEPHSPPVTDCLLFLVYLFPMLAPHPHSKIYYSVSPKVTISRCWMSLCLIHLLLMLPIKGVDRFCVSYFSNHTYLLRKSCSQSFEDSSGACDFSFRYLEGILVPSENTGYQVYVGRAESASSHYSGTHQGRAEPEDQVSFSFSNRADVILLGTGSRPMSKEAKEATQNLLAAHRI